MFTALHYGIPDSQNILREIQGSQFFVMYVDKAQAMLIVYILVLNRKCQV